MNIVIIEDNRDHFELISDILIEANDGRCKITHFPRLTDGLVYVADHHVDLLLCDLKLPDSDIEQTVARLKHIENAPAIIVLTSLNDDSLADRLVKQGIQDYIPKDDISKRHLVRTCRYAIERRKLTRELVSKNEDYRAFCYSLTHDFRGNLWQIGWFAELFKKEAVKRGIQLDELPFEHLDKVQEKVKNIQNIVDDLQSYLSLDVAQNKSTRFNLGTPFNSALDNLSELIESRQAQVRCEYLPDIHGNITQIQLLFHNLLTNAILYNDKAVPEITVSMADDTPYFYVIRVEDNGLGIDPEEIERIFIPFERGGSSSGHPGSGLGLSIVKKIVQYHRGRINLSSTPGKGTCFMLSLAKGDPTIP